MTDIDIDFRDRNDILKIIQHVPAAINNDKKHNTGIYPHKIPVNPLTGAASIDYKEAELRGYFKLDFLNVNVYKDILNEDHLVRLMNQEPVWELLLQEDFVNLLFHLNGHIDILKKTKPSSVEQLAAVLAMIRPAKKYLIGSDWNTIFKEVWIKPTTNEYYWKKSHAFGYAMLVIVQMNLISEQLMLETFSDS